MKKPEENIFERLGRLIRENRRVAMATVVGTEGSTPREAGARMLVFPDGDTEGTVGGGILEKKVTEEAVKMLEEKIPSRLVRYRLTAEDDGGIGGACGGDSDVFIEVFEPAGGVLVCGGGHVGRAVARVAAAAGFAVTIADEKPEPLGDEVFPPPRFLSVRPDDASILREVTESTAVVVVTRSHALDYSTLKLLVGSPAFYVGMIGSKKKVGGIMKKLEDDGVEQALLEKVYTPIGLDIGAETPAEIAVSIVSEIISARRREKPSPLSMKGQRDG